MIKMACEAIVAVAMLNEIARVGLDVTVSNVMACVGFAVTAELPKRKPAP